MTCTSCGNLQCYVCSETVKDYNHFDQIHPGARGLGVAGSATKQCPLYDNVEERHEREVKQAEEAARAEVLAENPNIDQADLDIKVSDAVKKSTADRVGQAAGGRARLGGNHALNVNREAEPLDWPHNAQGPANGLRVGRMLGADQAAVEHEIARDALIAAHRRLHAHLTDVQRQQSRLQMHLRQAQFTGEQQQELQRRLQQWQAELARQAQQAHAAIQLEGLRMMGQGSDPRLRVAAPYERTFIAQHVVAQPRPQGFIPVYGFAPQILPRWLQPPVKAQVPGMAPRMAQRSVHPVAPPFVGPSAPQQPANRPAEAPVFFDVARAALEGEGIDPLQRLANDSRLRETLYRVNPAPADNAAAIAAANTTAFADRFGLLANHAAGTRQPRVGLEHLENLRVAHNERLRARGQEEVERARQRVEEANRRLEEVNESIRRQDRRA